MSWLWNDDKKKEEQEKTSGELGNKAENSSESNVETVSAAKPLTGDSTSSNMSTNVVSSAGEANSIGSDNQQNGDKSTINADMGGNLGNSGQNNMNGSSESRSQDVSGSESGLRDVMSNDGLKSQIEKLIEEEETAAKEAEKAAGDARNRAKELREVLEIVNDPDFRLKQDKLNKVASKLPSFDK